MTSFSITTRGGDDGRTDLFSGERVAKNSPRTEAYGDLDELNSILGLARATVEMEGLKPLLEELQQDLFVVGSELATTSGRVETLTHRVNPAFLERLDSHRDRMEAGITMPGGFIVPGGTAAGATLDFARSVARRFERKVVTLAQEGEVTNESLLAWVNRLSDYLWLMARMEEGDRGCLKEPR